MSNVIKEENLKKFFVKNCSNCFIPINGCYYLLCCHCGCEATIRICTVCLKEHLEHFPSRKPLANQMMLLWS